MLCVTISERIVRNTSRPISTGRQTFTNASSPTNARSPIARVAHGSRWPPPPMRTERPPRSPRRGRRGGSGARGRRRTARARRSRRPPRTRRRARPELDAVRDDDARRDDERALAEVDVVADLPPRTRAGACTLSAGGSARNVVLLTQEPLVGRRLERARRPRRDRTSPAARRLRSRRLRAPGSPTGAAAAFCASMSASTSFSVMKPRFSTRREVDAVQLGELDRLPRRLAVARGRLRRRLLLRLRVDRRELVGGLRDVGDRLAELDLDVLGVELHDRPRAGRLDLDRRLRRLDDADRLARGRPPLGPRRATPREARTRCSRLRA